jgi:hypothetical protein
MPTLSLALTSHSKNRGKKKFSSLTLAIKPLKQQALRLRFKISYYATQQAGSDDLLFGTAAGGAAAGPGQGQQVLDQFDWSEPHT